MLFKDKSLLIFDLDGTLINSASSLASSVNYALEKIGLEQIETNKIKLWIGNGAQTLVRRSVEYALKDTDKNIDNVMAQILPIFLQHYRDNLLEETHLYDGVKGTLEYLKEKNYVLAIATNKPHKYVEPILEHFDILNLFALYLGADVLKEKKPSAMPLLYICKHFDIKPEYSLMIGDSKNDIIAGKNANIETIAVTYGYNYNQDISKENPTYIINNFVDIKDIL